MNDSWKDENCAAMTAHYAIYSIPHAAALWCGVTDDLIDQVLAEVTQVSPSGLGRSIWKHPDAPCVEPRSRAIAEAIESGELPHGREDGKSLAKGEYAAHERRHIFGRDLKAWMEKAFPNEKPAFLFDDIERNSHTSINADSYRSLKAERDALKLRVDKAVKEFVALRKDKEAIEVERDSLRLIADQMPPMNGEMAKADLDKSQYWNEFGRLASAALSDYPEWRANQNRIQKTGNLQEWLTETVGANNREAEIIKKILSDFYQELR